MQRNRAQVLYSYLPGTVFVHPDGTVVRSHQIRGQQLTGVVNETVLLDELERYLHQWPEERRIGLPLPSRSGRRDFLFLEPAVLNWDLWPLVFECARDNCGRIHTFRRPDEVTRTARCRTCRGRLRQMRYYSAHECGAVKPMYVPKCTEHGYDHIYFEDTGTFLTSKFRCRACGGAVRRRTAYTPCSCDMPTPDGGRPNMRAYTVRDTRTYYPHYVSLINLQSHTFNEFQQHPSRGDVAAASYLGAITSVFSALREADAGAIGRRRATPEEWAEKERRYREMGLGDDEIATLRTAQGPAEHGLASLPSLEPAVAELASQRRVVERAALWDRDEVSRITLDDSRQAAVDRGQPVAAQAIQRAAERARELGIDEISVTWEFPIATAAFGYTRSVREPGVGNIRGFAQRGMYSGKTPVFAVTNETEAVLVTLSATRVLAWLSQRGSYTGDEPASEQQARLEVLRMFAEHQTSGERLGEGEHPADAMYTLVHTLSHALLRALDDGQIGVAESSLAEWMVPENLTFSLYTNNLNSYTLGALWTLISNRTRQWLDHTRTGVHTCENDPLCHQRDERACERCLYLTFGCRDFNANLSRAVLAEFWSGA